MSDSTPRLPMCCPHELSRRSVRKTSADGGCHGERLIWECAECGIEMKVIFWRDIVDGQEQAEWVPVYE